MEKVLEKKLKRFVLGAIEDGKCYFLKIIHTPVKGSFVAKAEYECTFDIEQSTKYTKREIAEAVLDTYKHIIGDDDALEFVILPLEIDYNLIKEI